MAKRKTTVRTSAKALGGMELPSPLRSYQRAGVLFFAQSDSALLADEMGLGKTVQTILAIRLLKQANLCQRALIVTPRSLCKNWQHEFGTWAPNLLVRIVEGSGRNRRAQYHLPIPVLIATYDQIRVDTNMLDGDTAFDIVVLDEAQRIKDQSSDTSIACRGIPRSRSWALTGTPVENRPDDLISLFSFVRRQLLFRGIAVGDLHKRIKPFFLRRTKKDVLPELPPILIQDLNLELRGNQLEAYEDLWRSRLPLLKHRRQSSAESRLLALITKLKQVCNVDLESGESVKLEALKVILENFSLPTDKALVFSQYVRTLKWLCGQLGGIPHRIYHGGLRERDREETIRWFRESPGPRVLLMSLKAGGVGLNLQEASTVVMFDRWWNPAVEDQAMQRAHRFGRCRPLHVVRFLVEDTIEERIDNLLKAKRILFEEYVSGASNAEVPELSSDDLWRILGLAPSRPRKPKTRRRK